MTKKLSTKQFYARIANIILALGVGVGILLGVDVFLPPYIKSVTLEDHLSVTFNRPMDRRSVEQALSLEPPLDGEFSWRGSQLTFQLHEPLQYDQEIELTIAASARDINGKTLVEPFSQSFATESLQLLFIGTSDNNKGRLVLYNAKTQQQQILTDPSFIIDQFAPFPGSNAILILGAHPNEQPELHRFDVQTKQLTRLTNDPEYLNHSFAVSPTGKNIALSRIQLAPDGTYISNIQVWIASTNDYHFKEFLDGRARGSDIHFSFDGSHILYLNQDYVYELAPITAEEPEEIMFIGKEFNRSHGFHPSKPMILFNTLDNNDLFSIDNDLIIFYGDGSHKMIPFEDGITRESAFSADGKKIITIFSTQNEALEDPLSFYPLRVFHLYAYDLESGEIQQLTEDSIYSEEEPNVSPNGQYILFRRFNTDSSDLMIDPAYREMADSLGTITTGELWLYELSTSKTTNLHIDGSQAQFFSQALN